MDNVLINIQEISNQVLPLLGAIALIVVIILLINLLKTVKSLNTVLTKGSETVDGVNKSIEKVQAPLDTAVKLSNTVDRAHDATIKSIENAKEYLAKGADALKDKVADLIEEKHDYKEIENNNMEEK